MSVSAPPEPACESQGCHCTASLPCDDTECDGRQRFDGSTIHCTMCQRELEALTDGEPQTPLQPEGDPG
jgi:hypothetical protein